MSRAETERGNVAYGRTMLRSAITVACVAALAVAAGPAGSTSPLGEGYDPPPPAAPPPPPAAGGKSLVAAVGPNFTISLRTAAGTRVRTLKAGRYTITVNDRSKMHNFHLFGPGVNRKTGVAYMGTSTWTVRFRKGKQYRFRCDPHLFSLRGSFRVR
jgi:hypothetical protein